MIWWKRFWSRDVLGGVKTVVPLHRRGSTMSRYAGSTLGGQWKSTRLYDCFAHMQLLSDVVHPQMTINLIFWSFCYSFSNWVWRLSWLSPLVWFVLEIWTNFLFASPCGKSILKARYAHPSIFLASIDTFSHTAPREPRNKIPFKSQLTQATIHKLRLPFNFSPALLSPNFQNTSREPKKKIHQKKKKKSSAPLNKYQIGGFGRERRYVLRWVFWREGSIFF